MTAKTSKKTTKNTDVKKTKTREPSPAAVLKKVATVSDNTKELSKEIKEMTKIFAANQKVLVSMKDMIDTITSALELVQKQSKQINIIEEDTQKLFAGLNQVRNQATIVNQIHEQSAKLQQQVNKIDDIQKASPKTEELSQKVSDSMHSIRNNSEMIIKIAQRMDEVKDDLRKVSGKTDSFLDITKELTGLKNNLESITGRTQKDSEIIASFKAEFETLAEKADSYSSLIPELELIKGRISQISNGASKIDVLNESIQNLKEQFSSVLEKSKALENLNSEISEIKTKLGGITSKTDSIAMLGGKLDRVETEIGSLTKRADATAFVGESLKTVQEDITDFKTNIFDKTNTIEQKISTLSDFVKRSDAASAEFHQKTDKVFNELHSLKNVTNKASDDSAKEMMALLKLSEYQSNIRIIAESKYGDPKDLEKMGSQTAEIVNLFDKVSIEAQQKMPVPQEVIQWAVSKILDCSDRWEIRFSEVFTILQNSLGRELLKETIRIQQIRDIFGIRAVDEIKKELNIQ